MRHTYCVLVVAATLAACVTPGHTENSVARDLSTDALPAMALSLGARSLTQDRKHDKTLLKGVEAVGATALITDLLKATVREPRPNGGNRSSFPSGHASAAFAMATVLADEQPKMKWFWYLLAGGVSWSRVDLRAHHTHDVIAGAALGTFIADAVIKHSDRHNAGGGGVTLFHKTW
jgi:membrane-associated phospholipid phosphatase